MAIAAAMTLSACGGSSSSADTTAAATVVSTASGTAGVLCDYSSSVPYSSTTLNTTATATWSCSSTQRSIKANGLPDHAIGTFPNDSNPNNITEQNISASVTLTGQRRAFGRKLPRYRKGPAGVSDTATPQAAAA